MNKFLKVFFILWAVLLGVSFVTASDSIGFGSKFGGSAVLALIAAILFFGKLGATGDKVAADSGKKCLEIHAPFDPKVLYRIENGLVYKGLERKPIYEIKNNQVCPIGSSRPKYRIENNRVFRGMEVAPLYEIRNGRIYTPLSSKYVYEIKEK